LWDKDIFNSDTDSEVIVHLLAKTKNGDIKAWIKNALMRLRGAFSLVFMMGNVLVGARDPFGFRPLCLGKKGDAYILVSETCALDLIGAQLVRELEPGEIVFISDGKVESVF